MSLTESGDPAIPAGVFADTIESLAGLAVELMKLSSKLGQLNDALDTVAEDYGPGGYFQSLQTLTEIRAYVWVDLQSVHLVLDFADANRDKLKTTVVDLMRVTETARRLLECSPDSDKARLQSQVDKIRKMSSGLVEPWDEGVRDAENLADMLEDVLDMYWGIDFYF